MCKMNRVDQFPLVVNHVLVFCHLAPIPVFSGKLEAISSSTLLHFGWVGPYGIANARGVGSMLWDGVYRNGWSELHPFYIFCRSLAFRTRGRGQGRDMMEEAKGPLNGSLLFTFQGDFERRVLGIPRQCARDCPRRDMRTVICLLGMRKSKAVQEARSYSRSTGRRGHDTWRRRGQGAIQRFRMAHRGSFGEGIFPFDLTDRVGSILWPSRAFASVCLVDEKQRIHVRLSNHHNCLVVLSGLLG